MINITLITVGTLKEKYLKDACSEYIKRLGAFCKISTLEVKEYRLPENPSAGETEKALLAEAQLIKKSIPQNSTVITMCVEGKQLSSDELAVYVDDVKNTGSGKITVIIGSSHGLSVEVKNLSSLKLSISRMTFPHQLCRVMMLEQLYRAFTITAGKKYHK